MEQFKESIKEIIFLEISKKNLEKIKELLDFFLNKDIVDFRKQNEREFNELKAKFDNLNNLIKNTTLTLNDLEKSSYIYKTNFKLIIFFLFLVFSTLLLIITKEVEVYKSQILSFIAIIGIIVFSILVIKEFSSKMDCKYTNLKYEKKLLKFITNQEKLKEINNEIKQSDDFENKYQRYEYLMMELENFKKRNIVLRFCSQNIFHKIEKDLLVIESMKEKLYEYNKFPKEYQNFLSIATFYEYLEQEKCRDINSIYNLYEKEYGQIIGNSKKLLMNLSKNKLDQYLNNLSFEKLNSIINSLKEKVINGVINSSFTLKSFENDINNLVREIESEFDFTNKVIEFNMPLNLLKVYFLLNLVLNKSLNIKIQEIDNQKIVINSNKYPCAFILNKESFAWYNIEKISNKKTKINKYLLKEDFNSKEYKVINLDFSDILVQYKNRKNDDDLYKVKYSKTRYVEFKIKYLIDIINILGKDIECYYSTSNELLYFISSSGEKALLINKKS